jgi:NarL family two-component system sensor histidine kinase YdfH
VQRIRSLIGWIDDEDIAAGGPFYLFLFLVLLGAYVAVLVTIESMRRPGPLAWFTGLMSAHAVLHGLSVLLVQRRRWIPAYCLVQGALAFAIGYLTQSGAVIMGLNMALVGQAVGLLWPNWRATAGAAFLFIALALLNVALLWGPGSLLQFVPALGGVLIFVLLYVVLYLRQVRTREEAQALLQELERAHGQLQDYAERVEELTISQERQRMARELHDTLVQGVAGLILQLEAADSHLDAGRAERAQAVLQQAMQLARLTLHDARRAIQALRPVALELGNLVEALEQEVGQFAVTSGLQATFVDDSGPIDLPPDVAQEILRIVQEGLRNIARHAQASHALVKLTSDAQGIRVGVQDDGVGFEPGATGERPGRFGLAGMRERAERIGGTLHIESEPGRGTRLTLVVAGGGG